MLEKVVGVSHCPNYDETNLKRSLKELLELLEGLGKNVQQGSKVLIKPNLLTSAHPAQQVTTNPTLIKVLIAACQEIGAKVYVGDSPGRGSTEEVAKACGILEVVQERGATLLPFSEIEYVTNENAFICREFPLAKEALEVDFIINVAKLKTHSLTGLTAAVKNCFGFIVGRHKVRYHTRYPLIHDFANMLLDLYLTVKPGLSIVDAVVTMEGPGPRSGRPKPAGALMASTNAVALDAACAELVGFSPFEVTTLYAAAQRNIFGYDLNSLEIKGPLEELRLNDFDKGASRGGWSFLWRIVPAWARNIHEQLRPWPQIGNRCIQCGACLEHCPVQAIRSEKESLQINYEKCIRCYCCQEICPEGAIGLKNKRVKI